MSDTCQINIKDEQAAINWREAVNEINEKYFLAMREASDALTGMTEFCEGTLVDDFVEFGSNMLTAAESTFNAIKEIATTVNNILDTVKNFTTDVVGGIGRAVQSILG